VSIEVRTITADQHLAFINERGSASFLQTPAWADVKSEWRGESIGFFDGATLTGVGLILYFVIAYVLTLFMNLLEVRAKSRLGAGPSLREVLSLRPERVNEAVGVGR